MLEQCSNVIALSLKTGVRSFKPKQPPLTPPAEQEKLEGSASRGRQLVRLDGHRRTIVVFT